MFNPDVGPVTESLHFFKKTYKQDFVQKTSGDSRAEVYTRIPPLLSENKGVKPIPLLISRDKSVRVYTIFLYTIYTLKYTLITFLKIHYNYTIHSTLYYSLERIR